MERTPVVSSNIHSIGWDEETQILEIAFKNREGAVGSVYQYFSFPAEEFDAFLAAPSKGKFLWTRIRDIYEYERVE